MAHLKLRGKGRGGMMPDMSPRAPDPRETLKARMQNDALKQLTRLDAKTLQSMFDGMQYQGDQSAPLNEERFAQVMASSGHPVFRDKGVVRSFFRAMDSNGNGHVDQKELMVGLLTLASGELGEKLKRTPLLP
eukprot:m51a1_g13607 hypothetical protein (133) ;mRNA; f:1269-1859